MLEVSFLENVSYMQSGGISSTVDSYLTFSFLSYKCQMSTRLVLPSLSKRGLYRSHICELSRLSHSPITPQIIPPSLNTRAVSQIFLENGL